MASVAKVHRSPLTAEHCAPPSKSLHNDIEVLSAWDFVGQFHIVVGDVRGTLFEQVLVLPSAGPIDGRKMSAGGMEAQTKTAKTRAAVRRDFKLTCVPARCTVPHDPKVSSSRPETHVRA